LKLPRLSCHNLSVAHSRFITEGVAEASQIFLQNTQVLPKLLG
jgi:hypothetical protein